MRRLLFVAIAVVAAGSAAWLRSQAKASSFAPYSDAQLATLEAGYRAVMRAPPAPPSATRMQALARREASIDADVSLGLLETERHRRKALLGALAVAALAAVGALLPRRGGSARTGDEERRLAQAMGDPAALLEGERHRAARLLGVHLEAPPAVVDAALAAQLASHDVGRLDGLAPDLRKLMLEQRDALQRARDLLVRGSARRSADHSPQQ
jgi:hypothetical protein